MHFPPMSGWLSIDVRLDAAGAALDGTAAKEMLHRATLMHPNRMRPSCVSSALASSCDPEHIAKSGGASLRHCLRSLRLNLAYSDRG